MLYEIRWESYHGSSWIRLSRVESSRKTPPTNSTCIRSTMALKLRGDLLAAKEKAPDARSGPNGEEQIELKANRKESVLRSERRTPGSAAEEDAIAAAAVASDGRRGWLNGSEEGYRDRRRDLGASVRRRRFPVDDVTVGAMWQTWLCCGCLV